ncbi:MAG: SRPBCC domain-containing protein [Hyphomonadaceae bacterium]|nr:SRPBCC domain-containing protein [Hyphomonadaceae bacterium]
MTPPDANLPDRPDYVAVTYFKAPIERVRRVFTDPADQAINFGGKTEIGEVGERWIRHASDKWPAITGGVLAKEPAGCLVLTWGFDANPPPDHVEFLIEPAANGVTRVTIKQHHSRDWPEDLTNGALQGWNALLAGPKTLVETGTPLPAPF